MSTLTTSKRIDLGLLATALGGASLSARSSAGSTTIDAPNVPAADLQAAVDAHNAPDPALLDANEISIRDKAATALADNKTFLAITSPTNAQIAAQVKALTRQNNGLIRLVLHRFDATD